jgi:hypothetical protein
MKTTTLITLFFTLTLQAFSTGQAGDILVYKGDTVTIFSTPLEFRENIDSIRYKLFEYEEINYSTGCWRGYIATWNLINDSLFLTSIVSCDESKLNADLNKLLPNEISKNGIFAKWFVGSIDIPSGKLLEYVHMGFESIYENEDVLEFNEGILTNSKTYKNTVKKSDFWNMNPDKLLQNIYKRVNWSNIPIDKQKNVQTFLRIVTEPAFIIDFSYSFTMVNGQIDTSLNNPYMIETIRVAKEIPSWDYYERKGIVLKNNFSLLFTHKNRKKYVR